MAAHSSLADWLRSLPDDALAALLRARRDLATPPPANSDVLATRAGTAGSVARACEDLDSAALAVLETLLVAGADTEPVPADRLATLLASPPALPPGTLDRLRSLALVWGDDDALAVPAAARDVFGPFPAGLGASSPQLAAGEPGTVAARLDDLGDDERALVSTLSAGPPIGRTRDAATTASLEAATTPVAKLLARGLLLRRDEQTVELPREVGLALRGGVVPAPDVLTEPELPTSPHPQSTVDAAAAGEAAELLRLAEALLRAWSEQPPPVLKAGGLGVRELRRLARELDLDERTATLVVELVAGAGLVASDDDPASAWVPTTLTDSWLSSPPSGRWLTLATAWLDLPRMPGLAGARDARDKVIVPLSEEARRPLAPSVRRRVLGVLADLPGGCGVKSVDELVALLAWRAPRKGGRLRDQGVRDTVAEAGALGIVGLGALTTAGGALLDDDPHGAAAAMAEALPQPVDHVLVQADHTVVAPGPLEPDLARQIEAVADVESAGHATMYRVSETSVRRALDAGRTADELHELFRARSRTPVPQSLSYLVDDVARRHGRLRGGVAASFLRCDDEVLLTEVLGTQAASELELRRIAPTVLVCPYPLAEVLDALRGAGFAPAAEGPDGRVLDLRPRGRRIAARGRPARRTDVTGRAGALGDEQLRAVLAHVRAGDRAARSRKGSVVRLPGGGGADTSATMALLSRAASERREVWIGFVDSHGTATQRVVTPVRVGAGLLETTAGERYPLHRITSAALVED
ncbi:DNA-binding protein [Saccharomonospora piscinae]|uniref:DNA-binding protein n=1 Tax=Saccharomonospora piscinae TaxID=687388 RepID=A0A1V9A6I9_SACPI|nr:helicase-associated domain-containing protein [Saccharomonospora piscinae]OQO92723.1 DNA-binding protein [Saccharomonospora piscinae]